MPFLSSFCKRITRNSASWKNISNIFAFSLQNYLKSWSKIKPFFSWFLPALFEFLQTRFLKSSVKSTRTRHLASSLDFLVITLVETWLFKNAKFRDFFHQNTIKILAKKCKTCHKIIFCEFRQIPKKNQIQLWPKSECSCETTLVTLLDKKSKQDLERRFPFLWTFLCKKKEPFLPKRDQQSQASSQAVPAHQTSFPPLCWPRLRKLTPSTLTKTNLDVSSR